MLVVLIFVNSARNQALTNIYAYYLRNLLHEKLYNADLAGLTYHLRTVEFNDADEFYQGANRVLYYDLYKIGVTDTLMVRWARNQVSADSLTYFYVSMLIFQHYHIYVRPYVDYI